VTAKTKTETRTETIIETHERWIVRRTISRAPVLCAACGSLAEMLTPEEAAKVAGVDSETIYHWVESEQIHFAKTADGRLLVCLSPLSVEVAIQKSQGGAG
jgi:excisionase family DNA binding protein